MSEDIPIQRLKGIGPSVAQKLAKIGIQSLSDLLFHLPHRYEDRTRVTALGSLRHGAEAVAEGEVVGADVVFGRRRSLLCLIQDTTGTLGMRFYHFSKAQQNNLQRGTRIRCFGEARQAASGLEMYHPEYQVIGPQDTLPETLTAVYPVTAGITQSRMRLWINDALQHLQDGFLLPDLLADTAAANPPSAQLSLADALGLLHQPPGDADLTALLEGAHPAQQRLAFEELVAHRCGLRLVRKHLASLEAPPMRPPSEQYQKAVSGFGFPLTSAQRRVAGEIAQDMVAQQPMLRLLQGDVGSGKTVVAALAAVHALESGYQSAIMAPTEILAEQHYLNFTRWFEDSDVTIAWLSGKVKGKARSQQMALIATGTASIVIGTHALFQADVSFRKLGLVVIDEQHRFGVQQRMELLRKGVDGDLHPHQLIMTATPIPRTLTMSLYADMDSSVIDELPPGRLPVTTSVVSGGRRDEVISRVRAACKSGAQAYWVCTLIDDTDDDELKAAETTADDLARALAELQVGLIHGRMKPQDKTAAMDRFKSGETHLLVATTVIEVGVDVPNASLMIIDNPERLGLAQLHQLRGRVGRGSQHSHCLLLYGTPLSVTAQKRLNVMRETNDGFRIAEMDLELRGPGEVLGNRQAGSLAFRVADLIRDRALLPNVKTQSDKLMASDHEVAEQLIRRWLTEPELLGQV